MLSINGAHAPKRPLPRPVRIAIFGTGTVGLAAIMAARVAGCTTIVGVDVRPARLELATELGATHVVAAGDADPVLRMYA
jgi:aryl-alcohol dehydrogenase